MSSAFVVKKPDVGHLEVIHGPMFSGKSEELFRRLKRYHMAGRKVLLVKSTRDVRYGTEEHTHAASHSGLLFPASAVDRIDQVGTVGVDVIGVDEGQFMGEELTRWCTHVASNLGKIVIVSTLDTNFRMEPFENVMALLCVAESSTKLSSICCVCGADAYFTKRLTKSVAEFEVGGNDMYVPTCRAHHHHEAEVVADEYISRVEHLTTKLNKSI